MLYKSPIWQKFKQDYQSLLLNIGYSSYSKLALRYNKNKFLTFTEDFFDLIVSDLRLDNVVPMVLLTHPPKATDLEFTSKEFFDEKTCENYRSPLFRHYPGILLATKLFKSGLIENNKLNTIMVPWNDCWSIYNLLYGSCIKAEENNTQNFLNYYLKCPGLIWLYPEGKSAARSTTKIHSGFYYIAKEISKKLEKKVIVYWVYQSKARVLNKNNHWCVRTDLRLIKKQKVNNYSKMPNLVKLGLVLGRAKQKYEV